MAGIIADSASVTMAPGATTADNSNSGYVTGEQITLSATPTGAAYTWGLAIPQGSASGRSGLSSTSAATPTFTPDVGGTYTITADVDGTAYVLRLTVTQAAIAQSVETLRLSPIADSAVPAPAAGSALYASPATNGIAAKDSDGNVRRVVDAVFISFTLPVGTNPNIVLGPATVTRVAAGQWRVDLTNQLPNLLGTSVNITANGSNNDYHAHTSFPAVPVTSITVYTQDGGVDADLGSSVAANLILFPDWS